MNVEELKWKPTIFQVWELEREVERLGGSPPERWDWDRDQQLRIWHLIRQVQTLRGRPIL